MKLQGPMLQLFGTLATACIEKKENVNLNHCTVEKLKWQKF